MDVAEWLGGLGLPQHAENFVAEGIDLSIISSLSDQDLKDLGVALMGHRRKIMAAAAEIKFADPSPTVSAAPAMSSPPPPPRAKDEAERRPITVMFCDLVGSTSLAAKLDAEDWRDLVGAYLDEASKAVAEFGGHVLKKLGDGLMALFGYPRAQENDAERAARAGLAILRSLEALNARNVAKGLPALAARIGLESGPVVVDQTGEVFGEAPNVSARVQSAAEPGTLLVTANVQRQVAGLFVAEDKGPHELKGVAGKPTLYRLVRASGGGRRIFARNVTAFVGREDELSELARRWERARSGDGQFVQIVGEPGLGKSRLIEELRGRLAETPHTWVEWAALQLLQMTPLHPLAEWGRQRFAGEARLAELEAALASVKLDPAEHGPLLAPLLDIALPEHRAPKLAAEELRRRQLAAVVAWLMAGARTQPIVLAFEDLHWADPTTQDLMKTLAERGAQAPLLIVATARPEFRAPWTTRTHHGVISLAPLDRAEIRTMVGAIAERHALSKDIVEGVANRTGGVPLFVEEVTRLMLEGGAQTIPPTLQQSLAARLDRVGEAREIAQIGAVLGREFSYNLLKSVAGVADPGRAEVGDLGYSFLDAALEKLVEADLLFVEGVAPAATYRFKHALIQDAAYESLLKARRQALHRRAAEALLASPDPQPELVAHHFTQSNQSELAVEWWGKAGDAALRRSAFQEAISHLGKAIEMGDLPGTNAPKVLSPGGPKAPAKTEGDTRAKLHSGYALATMMTKGFGAEETKAALARAETATGTARTPQYWAVWYGRINADQMRGDFRSARASAEAFLAEAEADGLKGHAAVARLRLGFSKYVGGELAAARRDYEQALADHREGDDASLRATFSIDFRSSAFMELGGVAFHLGEFEEAERRIGEAITRANDTGSPINYVYALYARIVFCALSGRIESILADIAELRALAEAHGLRFYTAMAASLEHWTRARLGEPTAEAFRASLGAYAGLGARLMEGWLQSLLADVELAAGRRDEALAAVERGLELAAEMGHGLWRPWFTRQRGDALAESDPAGAASAYREAIKIAGAQGARPAALLAALALAKVLPATGEVLEAHAALSEALVGFSPTPLFPAVAEAHALLAALGESEPVKAEVARRGQRVKMHVDYAQALAAVKGYAAEETLRAYDRMDSLAPTPRSPEHWVSLVGRCVAHLWRGELADAERVASMFLREAEAARLDLESATACRLLGATKLRLGEYGAARPLFEKALALGADLGSAATAPHADFLSDTWALSTGARWPLGEFDACEQLWADAINRARAIKQHLSLAVALGSKLMALAATGRADAARSIGHELHDHAREHGVSAWASVAGVILLWAEGRADPMTAVGRLRDAVVEREQRTDQRILQPLFRALLAETEAAAGAHEDALASIAIGLKLIEETGERWAEPMLHRVSGDILSLGDPVAAEAAYRESIRIAHEQGARTFVLLAALPLARFLQTNNRPLEAYDALAPALEGFAPTPELPEIAEAQALVAALAELEEVKAEAARRDQRRRLHAGYALATMAVKGYAAEETRRAYERIEAAPQGSRSADRWARLDGQWANHVFRGELRDAQAIAETFLSEAEAAKHPLAAASARRLLGFAKTVMGEFLEAKAQLEQSLSAYSSDWSDATQPHADFLCDTWSHSGFARWHLGEVDAAADLVGRAIERGRAIEHRLSLAVAISNQMWLAAAGGRADAAYALGQELSEFAERYGLASFASGARICRSWAAACLAGAAAGLADLRAAASAYEASGARASLPRISALLAEIEAAAGEPAEALRSIERGLKSGGETGVRFADSMLHRVRGDVLGLSDATAAEASYRESIGIARAQHARTFELLAALPLAKLLQTNNRPLDAHDALASALEGFARSAELPAIAEAQALNAELAADEAVAAELRKRETRSKLHAGYALATMMTKGYGAEETKAALARAANATEAVRAPEYWTILFGRINAEMMRGDAVAARASVEAFLAEAVAKALPGHAAFARRMQGFLKYMAGDLAGARLDLERALADYDERRDEGLRRLFGLDFLSTTLAYLGQVDWFLGDSEEAERLADAALRRAKELAQPVAWANALYTRLALLLGGPEAVLPVAEEMRALGEAHDLKFWRAMGSTYADWARVQLGEPRADAFRAGLAAYVDLGAKMQMPVLQSLLAEVELVVGRREEALAAVDRGLAQAAETGIGLMRPTLLRLRGDALVEIDPEGAASAYREAIALAGEQGARPIAAWAALPLARLRQSAGRLVEAHDALAPALEGFSPTPNLPHIAEAQALLASLAADEAVAAELRKREVRSKLHTGYALATMMSKGFASEETRAALSRAGAHVEAAKTPEYWTIRYGRLVGDLMAAKLDAVREGALAWVAEAETAGLPGYASVARRVLGFAKIIGGDFAGAAALLQRAVADYEDTRDAELNALFGHDLLANATSTLAQATWYLGNVAEAERLADAAIARAKTTGRVVSEIQAIHCRGFFAVQADRPQVLLEIGQQILALADRHGIAYWKTVANQSLLWARIRLGEPLADAYREELARSFDSGGRLMMALRYTSLAEIERTVGRTAAALAAIEQALAIGAENGEGEFTSRRLRIRASLRAESDPSAAEQDFRSAFELAQAQGSPTLTLFAALDLAKFLRARGGELEGHAILALALEGFSPTPELPAIAAAQTLLTELRS